MYTIKNQQKTLWLSLSTDFMKKIAIQRALNAYTRLCYSIPRRAYVTPYLNDKNILKMDARHRYILPTKYTIS